ncbi:MAG: toll/interleukin-1 receptor domain-containing protein [Clostridia bacterium]
MAGKKIKIGEIKITRRVTYRTQQTFRAQQSFEYDVGPVATPRISTPQATALPSSAKVSLPKPKTTIVRTNTRFINSAGHRHLQPGDYPLPVETLFDALEERRKPEEQATRADYDVFVSHASEDKAPYVNDLVQAFRDAGIKVWYDDTAMQWGKSLRQQIDEGIKCSRYAIFVLSKSYFKKTWTNRELNGILAKENVTGATPLPIWYDVSYNDVFEYSPMLADVKAFPTNQYSIDQICQAMQLTLQR